MFAINKKTGRKIVEVEVVATVVDEDYGYLRLWDKDGTQSITPLNNFDEPNPAVRRGTDDSGAECDAKDIELMETLPAGYDEDGEWFEDSNEHDAEEGVR